MANYPGSIATLTNPAAGDYEDVVSHSAQHANANDEIEATQTELGTDVAGTYADLKTRLAVTVKDEFLNIEALGAVAGSVGAGAANVAIIQTAVNLAGTAGGGDVFIPPGNFEVDGTAGTDLITIAPGQNSVNIVGVDRNVSKLSDLRSSGTTIAVKGTNASTRSKYHRFADFQITGAAGGTNSRKAFENKWCGHLTFERMQFWSTAHALYGYDWWDSLVSDCRFDQCSTNDGSALAAVHLRAQSSDATDCNSIRFVNNTWEQCWERDVDLYSAGRDVNKIRFYGNKLECGGSGFQKGDRVNVLGGDDITFVDNDWTIGDWYPSYTTQNVCLQLTNTQAVKVIGNRFEGAPATAGPVLSYMISVASFGGTTQSLRLIGNDFQGSTNNVATAGILYSNITNSDGEITDYGNGWTYANGGAFPPVRVGLPWKLTSDLVDVDPLYAYATAI